MAMGLGGVQASAPAQGIRGWYSGSAAPFSPTATSRLSAQVDKQAGRQDCMDLLSKQLYMKEGGVRVPPEGLHQLCSRPGSQWSG